MHKFFPGWVKIRKYLLVSQVTGRRPFLSSQNKTFLRMAAASPSPPTPEGKPGRKSTRGRRRWGISPKESFSLQAWQLQRKGSLSSLSLSVCLSLSLSLSPSCLCHSFICLFSQLVFIACTENWEGHLKTSLSSRHLLSSGVGASGDKYSVGWWQMPRRKIRQGWSWKEKGDWLF